jgi:hypothetical protein
MGIRCLGSLPDLFLSRGRVPIQDVLFDGAAEEDHLLGNQSDLVAERFDPDIPDIVPIKKNLPLGDIEETRDQRNQG